METSKDALFVDWLTVWQVLPPHLPVNSGAVVYFDGSANARFVRTCSTRVSGSHSTTVAVKSDGQSMVLSGNFGRFGHPDNLFNLDPAQSLRAASRVAENAGLSPLLSDAERKRACHPSPSSQTVIDLEPHRAETSRIFLSRIDLTKNFATGGLGNARALIRNISRRSISRVKRGLAGEDSVWWSNSRYMLKFYIKSVEMALHGDTTSLAYQYALSRGIVRCELELKRRILSDLGWGYFGDFEKAWDMGTVHKLFDDYSLPLLSMNGKVNPQNFLDSLPTKLQLVAAAFLHGENVRERLSRPTFYRYRKALLAFGLDIADEAPASIATIVREVEICAVSAPDWHWSRQA